MDCHLQCCQNYNACDFDSVENVISILLIFSIFSFVYFAGPKNYNGLLLRAEVLFRLGHFRSSLADAENAIKCRPTSCNVSKIENLEEKKHQTRLIY